jgi:hypothetical protein
MSIKWLGLNRSRSGLRVSIAATVLAAVMAIVQSEPVWGITTDPKDPSPCSSHITASLSASPPSISLGKETTTVSWNIQTSRHVQTELDASLLPGRDDRSADGHGCV